MHIAALLVSFALYAAMLLAAHWHANGVFRRLNVSAQLRQEIRTATRRSKLSRSLVTTMVLVCLLIIPPLLLAQLYWPTSIPGLHLIWWGILAALGTVYCLGKRYAYSLPQVLRERGLCVRCGYPNKADNACSEGGFEDASPRPESN